jgi:hypothetical protein
MLVHIKSSVYSHAVTKMANILSGKQVSAARENMRRGYKNPEMFYNWYVYDNFYSAN